MKTARTAANVAAPHSLLVLLRSTLEALPLPCALGALSLLQYYVRAESHYTFFKKMSTFREDGYQGACRHMACMHALPRVASAMAPAWQLGAYIDTAFPARWNFLAENSSGKWITALVRPTGPLASCWRGKAAGKRLCEWDSSRTAVPCIGVAWGLPIVSWRWRPRRATLPS